MEGTGMTMGVERFDWNKNKFRTETKCTAADHDRRKHTSFKFYDIVLW